MTTKHRFPHVSLPWILATLILAGNVHAQDTSAQGRPAQGKQATGLDAVPQDVLAVAGAERPGVTLTAAEHEVRNGNDYYDVEGTAADGSEIEFDITRIDGAWAVVEVQRDIDYGETPQAVRDAVAAHDAEFVPGRVIESVQADGLVVYELYVDADGSGGDDKVEVKFDGGTATILSGEWVH